MMKRIFCHIPALLAWTLLAITACQEKPGPGLQPDPDPVPPAEIALQSSPSISFASGGGNEKLLFTANRDWTVSTDADWLQLSPASGKASDKQTAVTVTCGANPDSKKRSAKVTVSAGDKTQAVSVEQAEGAPAFVPLTGLKISPESAVMHPGETLQLTLIYEPENATDKQVRWLTDFSGVEVSQDGLVTAILKGETRVRAVSDAFQLQAVCRISVEPVPPTAVDIGLPVKWSNLNVLADKPHDFNHHYAWGETEYRSKAFRWDDYKWWSDNAITKYNGKDKKVLLDQEDDAAFHVYGDGWKTPTKSDFEALLATRNDSNYKWEWTIVDTYYRGWKITWLKNGNSIYLTSGGVTSEGIVGGQFTWGFYWSSERVAEDETQAYYLFFDEDTIEIRQTNRSYGHEVRPVYVK